MVNYFFILFSHDILKHGVLKERNLSLGHLLESYGTSINLGSSFLMKYSLGGLSESITCMRSLGALYHLGCIFYKYINYLSTVSSTGESGHTFWAQALFLGGLV
jgi:hypothetical protein